MHNSNKQRFHPNFQTPVGWLRAISDGSHLIYLDWNQIGWTDPDRPDHVSRETITQLMAYFAGQRTHFTIPLRPANISPARQLLPQTPYPSFTLVTGSYAKWRTRALWGRQSISAEP